MKSRLHDFFSSVVARGILNPSDLIEIPFDGDRIPRACSNEKINIGDKRHWECIKLRSDKTCTSRATTNNLGPGEQLVLLLVIVHAHPPNFNDCEARKVKTSLKRKASERSEQPLAQLLRTKLSSVPEGVLSQLPLRENLKKIIRRTRRKDFPPNQKTLNEFDTLPDQYQKTLSDEKFLIFDFARSEVWFLDGTFKVNNSIFMQVFLIVGTIDRKRQEAGDIEVVTLSFVYALLSSKQTGQYADVLRAVETATDEYGIQNCRPCRFMTDFEKSIINACMEIHPNVSVSCCFFHLGQSIYKKIQEKGLAKTYCESENDYVGTWMHMFLTLAFVPVADVRRVYTLIVNDIKKDIYKTILPVIKYFRATYVLG
ncbi:hypothetical protein TKK_0017595 [Trichogramma kaykai]